MLAVALAVAVLLWYALALALAHALLGRTVRESLAYIRETIREEA